MRFCLSIAALLVVAAPAVQAQTDSPTDVNLDRAGIRYSIGTVTLVQRGEAQIDLGEVHSLKKLDRLAIFRPRVGKYHPQGVVTLQEVFGVRCRTMVVRGFEIEPGDIAITIREFSQVPPAGRFRDDYVRRQKVRFSAKPNYSTVGRKSVAHTLWEYQDKYGKWEKSSGDVIGFLNGDTWREGGEERAKNLLNYINLLRRHRSEGLNSAPGAGAKWESVMSVLYGPTAIKRHESSQAITEEDTYSLGQAPRPSVRSIERRVNEQFFDREPAARQLLAYIVLTGLESSPVREDLWLQTILTQSQYPELVGEESISQPMLELINELKLQ